MSDWDDDLRENLKDLGLEEARRRRACGDYNERKRPVVDEWIASQERKLLEEASERNLSMRSEEIDIARRAKNAADRAAMAATIAAIAASAVMIISVISLVRSEF